MKRQTKPWRAEERRGAIVMAASGYHVFVSERITGKRKGKTQNEKSVTVFKLDKSVVAEVADFPFDHPAVAQSWS